MKKIAILAAIINLILCGVVFAVGYVDFTDYTEWDSGSNLSISAKYIIFADLPRNASDYVYEDYGVGSFSNTSGTRFYLVAKITDRTSLSQVHLFCLANSVTDAYTMRNSDYENLTLYAYGDGSVVLWWEDGDGGHLSASSGSGKLSTDTWYYFEIDYNPSENKCTVYMRTGSHKGPLVSSFGINSASFTPSSYRYLYAIQSYNSGTASQECRGSIKDYFISWAYCSNAMLGKTCQSNLVYNGSYHTLVYVPSVGKLAAKYTTSGVFSNDVVINISSTASLSELDSGEQICVNYKSNSSPVSLMMISPSLGTRILREESSGEYNAYTDDDVIYTDNLSLSSTMTGISVGSSIYGVYAYCDNGHVYARRTTASYASSYNISTSLESATDLKTLSGTKSWTQCISWWAPNAGRLGVLYTDNDTLYYRDADYYFTTFQAEQTVSTDLYSLSCYRAVRTQNNKLFVFFRSVTDNKIYYSTRNYGSSSTWSTPSIINNDTEYDGDGYFTAIADQGHAEYVTIHYYNGTNIVSRTWNGSAWGSASTLFSSPSIINGNIQAPYETPFEYMVAIETTAGLDYERVVLSPDTLSSSGSLFTHRGAQNSMNAQNGMYADAYNGKVYMGCTRAGGASIENIYDVASSDFVFTNNTSLTNHAYADMSHNIIVRFVDNDGYAYIAEAGRKLPACYTSVPLAIYKSNYTIDNASFTFDKVNDWTDISPTSTYGRGYKSVLVDDDNVVYLLYSDYDQLPAGKYAYTYGINEYRSGSWGTYTNFIDFQTNGVQSYLQTCCLGKEASGQKSIHAVYGWRDNTFTNSTYGGSLGLNEYYYIRIVPDGEGGYDCYDSDSSSLSLPLDNLDGDVIYTQTDNYPTANTLVPCNLGTIDVIGTSTPVIATSMYIPGNGDPLLDTYKTGYYSWKPDGEGGWSRVTAADTDDGAPTSLGWGVNKATIAVTDNGIQFYVGTIEDANGYDQIGLAISVDDCATFSDFTAITSDSYNSHDPYLVPITNYSALLMWAVDVSQTHSEIKYDIIYLGLETSNIKSKGCTLTFTTCNIMSADYFCLYRSTSSDIDPTTTEPLTTINGATEEYTDRGCEPEETYYYLGVYYDSGDAELVRTEEVNITTLDRTAQLIHHKKTRRW